VSHDIVLDDVGLRYGRRGTEALRGVSLRLAAGTVCGLLGRNGSGKTSLLSLLASRRRPTAGTITVGGADPYENAAVMSQIALVGEAAGGSMHSVDDVRKLCATLRPGWDDDYAGRLLERFAVPNAGKIDKLSRGQRAALGVTCGLASGAAVTLFDEAHLGMDAANRAVFYDELLAINATGRTIVLSTHHIDEVAALFAEVVILDDGRLLAHAETDELRGRGTEITGPDEAVDRVADGLDVRATRRLGRTKAVVVVGELDEDRRRLAAGAGVDLGPLSLQDLFIALTGSPGDPAPTASEEALS
jgi:ABC-2 type transport system ATP-binding protein